MGQFKKTSIWLIAFLLSFIACLICGLSIHSLSSLLSSQNAAERWRGQNEQLFAHVSCFFPQDKLAAGTDIEAFRDQVSQRISEKSPGVQDASLWNDAYSSKSEVIVSGAHGDVQALAVGVGGHYFFFHPLRLLGGCYISGADLSEDQAVLDKDLAWKLFGSVDVVGMKLKIGQKTFCVAGVVSLDDDTFSKRADQSYSARIYLPHHALFEMTQAGISCYEIVMPEPVNGYVKSMVDESFDASSNEVVQNSERFTLNHLAAQLFSVKDMILHEKGIAYPSWENAARLIEYRSVHLLWLIVPFALAVLVCLILLMRRFVRLLCERSKTIKTRIGNLKNPGNVVARRKHGKH